MNIVINDSDEYRSSPLEWSVEHHLTDDIRRLRALLSGESVDGLHLDDPGLDRAWVERTLVTREQQLQRLTAPPEERPR